MTLCIAAVAQYNRKSAIVVASDWREETEGFAGAEIQNKFVWINQNWVALFAGEISRSIELVNAIRIHFSKKDIVITKDTVFDAIRAPILEARNKIVNEYLARSLAVPYGDFLKQGTTWLLEDEHRAMFEGIKKVNLDCDLLLCAFIRGAPFIFKVKSDASLEVCENFAAIGSGEYVAGAFLYRREHNAKVQLRHAIYHVFEAMDAGSIAPGVGWDFSVTVLSPETGTGKIVSKEVDGKYFAYLERQVKRYGLRSVTRIELKERHLKRRVRPSNA